MGGGGKNLPANDEDPCPECSGVPKGGIECLDEGREMGCERVHDVGVQENARRCEVCHLEWRANISISGDMLYFSNQAWSEGPQSNQLSGWAAKH